MGLHLLHLSIGHHTPTYAGVLVRVRSYRLVNWPFRQACRPIVNVFPESRGHRHLRGGRLLLNVSA